jgi:hypothetical protein
MKLRNSLFRMMLCSASTLHLAVDAKIPVSGRTVLPGPGGQTTTVEGSQRPQLKAAPRSDETLNEGAGAHVIDPVTGNGGLSPRRDLPGPDGQTTTVEGSQRPQLKAGRRKAENRPDGIRTRGSSFVTWDAIH